MEKHVEEEIAEYAEIESDDKGNIISLKPIDAKTIFFIEGDGE